jgi:hypothetical protein
MWLAVVLALVTGFLLGVLLMALLTVSSRDAGLSAEEYPEQVKKDPVRRLSKGEIGWSSDRTLGGGAELLRSRARQGR